MNKTFIGRKFRDRRAAFVGFVKNHVAVVYGVNKRPSGKLKDDAVKLWFAEIKRQWSTSEHQHLRYPRSVEYACKAGIGKCEYFVEGPGAHSLAIMEAFTLVVLMNAFSTDDDEEQMKVCKDTCGGKHLQTALGMVLDQQKKIKMINEQHEAMNNEDE